MVTISGMLANYFLILTTGFFSAGILRDLRRDLVNCIMKMAPDFMEKNNFGDLIERASSDIDGIAAYMQVYFIYSFSMLCADVWACRVPDGISRLFPSKVVNW